MKNVRKFLALLLVLMMVFSVSPFEAVTAFAGDGNVPASQDGGFDDPSKEQGNTNPSNDDPVNENPTNETPSDETPSGETPSNENPTSETPTGETPSNETPSNETPSNETPSNETPSNETPTGENPSNETPSNENEGPSNENPTNETPSNETPSNETPTNENPTNETPTNENPTNETPSNETPSNETPSNENPTDETPTDETPAEGKRGGDDDDDDFGLICPNGHSGDCITGPDGDGMYHCGECGAAFNYGNDNDDGEPAVAKHTVTWVSYELSNEQLVAKTLKSQQYDEGASLSGEYPAVSQALYGKQWVYSFVGWTGYTETVPTSDVTITADYSDRSPRTYSVTWVYMTASGQRTFTDDCDYGTTPSFPDGEENYLTDDTEYSFDSWTPSVTAIDGSKESYTYTATYTTAPRTYKITWKRGSDVVDTTYVEWGKTPAHDNITQDPTDATEYSFARWEPALHEVNGEETYTAVFDEYTRKYTVSFTYLVVGEDGFAVESTASQSLEYGSEVSDYVPAVESVLNAKDKVYTFTGWSPDLHAVDGEEAYVAQYSSTPRMYVIVWKVKRLNDEGKLVNVSFPLRLAYGTPLDEVTPEPESPVMTKEAVYTFTGEWSPEPHSVDGDETYVAQYTSTPRMYDVSWLYFTVGETGELEEVRVTKSYEYGASLEGEFPAAEAQVVTNDMIFTLTGWYPEVGPVYEEAFYQAQYNDEMRKANITWVYKVQDGDNAVKDATVISEDLEYGSDPSEYAPEIPTTLTTSAGTLTFTKWSPAIEEVAGEQTYTAEYDFVPYATHKITWIGGDGKVIDVTEVAHGEMPTHDNPSKEPTADKAFAFKEWSPAIVPAEDDATYTAVFDEFPREYEITWAYKVQDGDDAVKDATAVMNLAYGSDPSEYMPEIPTTLTTSAGTLTFTKWSPDISEVTGERTYTAQYSSQATIMHKITWIDGDGEVIDVTEVADGEMPTHDDPTKEPTKEKVFTFKEWSPTIVPADGDATYSAVFDESPREYTITWKFIRLNEGDEIEEDIIFCDYEYGASLEGEFPTVEEKIETDDATYTFVEWTPEAKPVDGEQTYIAVYKTEQKKFTITFVTLGGDTTSDEAHETMSSDDFERGTTPTAPEVGDFETLGHTYKFVGWEPEIVPVTGKATYTAQYEVTAKTFAITWLNDAGVRIDVTYVAYGDMPKHLDAQKDPTGDATYEFVGWEPEIVPVTGEATYTAKFNRIPNKYTVTWVNDDDTVLEIDENVVFGATPSYDGETPTKAATAQFTYTFAGWTPDILPVTKDIVYKATYGAEANEYVVTWYDDDKETILNQQTLPFGTMPEYHGEVPTKAATKEYTFTFAGWDPEMVPVAGDAAYVAVYLAKPIPVQQTQPPLTPEERSARMNRKFKVYYDEAPKATKGEPALVVEWGQTSGVSSYELFVSYMDEDAPTEPTVTLKANAFAAYFTELNGEQIDFTRCFAVYVVAKNWRGEEVGRTEIAYVAGPDSEYTNPASLTVTSEKSIRLSVGESSTIQAVVTLEDDARPEIPDVPAFRYACTRNNVVTISADGTITAVGRGSCMIQVYSKNVLVDEIKVTVR